MRKGRKALARWAAMLVLGAVTVLLACGVVLVSRASVETTASGVPTRLRLHFPGGRDMAFPVHGGAAEARIPGFLDGPIIRRGTDGSWTARWFCEDTAYRRTLPAQAPVLQVACAGREHAFPLFTPVVPPAVAPMPARVAVLSDLEGNIAFLDATLRRLGIVDAAGDWSWGGGHLVVLGDSVDRGRDVFAVLWTLHRLSAQAAAAGGAVHVVLGNHEQYMLRTNPTRANPEHLHALHAMGGYPDAFAADTAIGEWLRRQPVVLRLGDVLFAHAGISPATAATGLSVEQLNATMRDYWNDPGDHPPSPALDAVLGHTGVTQYRGYFRALEDRYPMATDAEVGEALDRFGARLVVVAHTVVPAVQRLRGGRVYAVDVNDNDAANEVLLFEGGEPRVVDIGIPRGIPGEGERRLRDFSLLDSADRALLAGMVRDLRRLSSLPYPY